MFPGSPILGEDAVPKNWSEGYVSNWLSPSHEMDSPRLAPLCEALWHQDIDPRMSCYALWNRSRTTSRSIRLSKLAHAGDGDHSPRFDRDVGILKVSGSRIEALHGERLCERFTPCTRRCMSTGLRPREQITGFRHGQRQH